MLREFLKCIIAALEAVQEDEKECLSHLRLASHIMISGLHCTRYVWRKEMLKAQLAASMHRETRKEYSDALTVNLRSS